MMGTEDYYEPTFEIRHADGNPTSVLKYVEHKQQAGETSILLRDEVYPVEVTLYYKVFPEEDIIQQWAEIRHEEKGKVYLGRYASSMLYFEAPRYFLILGFPCRRVVLRVYNLYLLVHPGEREIYAHHGHGAVSLVADRQQV